MSEPHSTPSCRVKIINHDLGYTRIADGESIEEGTVCLCR